MILRNIGILLLKDVVFLLPRRLYVLLGKVLSREDIVLLEVVLVLLVLEGLLDDGPLVDRPGWLELNGTEAVGGRSVGRRPNVLRRGVRPGTRGIDLQILGGRRQGSLL